MNEKYTPKLIDIKILYTVNSLNELGYFPNNHGVLKILKGEVDTESKAFTNLITFQTLVSYNSKKLSRIILLLVRYKYLEKKYDKNTDDLYLKISEKGKIYLQDYLSKHHPIFKKHQKINNPTIVKIEG